MPTTRHSDIRHMDFAASGPDELVRLFLTSDRLPTHADEAAVAFFNAIGVVTGPLHAGIERQAERARVWVEQLRETSAERWARDLASYLERDAERQRQRDVEDDLEMH
jgi:hypothetical protein